MELEDAIKHCEEVTKENDDSAKEFYRISKLETHPDRKCAEDGYVECKKCAAEHRQLAEWLKELLRARVLLKATHELLEKADDSPYVLNALEIIVNYDGAEYDGQYLKEEIEYYFDEYGSGQ